MSENIKATNLSIQWNEPGADPLADLQRWSDTRPTGMVPGTLTMGLEAYLELILWTMDFGWWPLSIWRRARERKRLLRELRAEAASLEA